MKLAFKILATLLIITNSSLADEIKVFDFTETDFLLNAFFNLSIVLSEIFLSTYTMALFKSPPLINPFSSNVSP